MARIDLELIERDAICDLYRSAARSSASALPRAENVGNATVFVASASEDDIFFNRVLMSNADVSTLDRVEPIVDEICPRWQLAVADGVNVGTSLEARGFERTMDWMKFRRDVQPVDEVPCDLRVARLRPQDGGAFANISEEMFRNPESLRAELIRLPGRLGWHCFGAFDGDQLAGVGVAFVRGDYAWFGMGATRPAYRRRGVQNALLAARINAAHAAGARVAVVETGAPSGEPGPSYRNILRAGFEEAYRRPNFVRS